MQRGCLNIYCKTFEIYTVREKFVNLQHMSFVASCYVIFSVSVNVFKTPIEKRSATNIFLNVGHFMLLVIIMTFALNYDIV